MKYCKTKSEEGFIKYHMKILKRANLSQLLDNDLHEEVLITFLPNNSYEIELLKTIRTCREFMTNAYALQSSDDWTELYNNCPSLKWEQRFKVEYERLKTVNSVHGLIELLRQMKFCATTTLLQSHGYMFFKESAERNCKVIRRILGDIVEQKSKFKKLKL